MIPALAVAGQLAERFRQRFPVKVNADPAGLVWERRPDLVLSPLAPRSGTFGGRRGGPVLWSLWAREAMLGSTVQLRTGMGGQTMVYHLHAPVDEAWGYLAIRAYGRDESGRRHIESGVSLQHLGWAMRVLAVTEAAVSAV